MHLSCAYLNFHEPSSNFLRLLFFRFSKILLHDNSLHSPCFIWRHLLFRFLLVLFACLVLLHLLMRVLLYFSFLFQLEHFAIRGSNPTIFFLSPAVREDRMPGGRNSGAVYNMYKVSFVCLSVRYSSSFLSFFPSRAQRIGIPARHLVVVLKSGTGGGSDFGISNSDIYLCCN